MASKSGSGDKGVEFIIFVTTVLPGHQRTHPRDQIRHLFRRSVAHANQNAMGGCEIAPIAFGVGKESIQDVGWAGHSPTSS